MRQVSREIEAMQRLQGHANVVDLHSVYENDAFIFLLMELCPDGDLFNLISERNGLPETEARYVFKKVGLAVQHCHRNGIVHRDIKPENILLRDSSPPSSTAHQSLDGPICPLPHAHDAGSSAALACGCAPSREWEVKLADFGLSRRLDEGCRVRGRVGSYPYEAPEVVASEPYDWSADVWSLGVLLYTMLAASWPEFKDGRRALNEDVDWSSPSWRLVSDPAKNLIRRLLTVSPCDRPTIDEVLCDAWLSDESCPVVVHLAFSQSDISTITVIVSILLLRLFRQAGSVLALRSIVELESARFTRWHPPRQRSTSPPSPPPRIYVPPPLPPPSTPPLPPTPPSPCAPAQSFLPASAAVAIARLR
ncbi:unnamed protein product [Closterium sp. NIES-53]